jgi:hypothetical protein
MRRELRRPPPKRKTRPLTAKKGAQRHEASRAQKPGPWPAWVRREAVSVIAKDGSDGGPQS